MKQSFNNNRELPFKTYWDKQLQMIGTYYFINENRTDIITQKWVVITLYRKQGGENKIWEMTTEHVTYNTG